MEDSPPTGDVDDYSDDIILDMLRRFAACVNTHEEKLAMLERQMRIEWGGLRPYIPKERGHGEVSRRHQRIRDEYRRGEHIEYLSRKYGLRFRTVQRIVSR